MEDILLQAKQDNNSIKRNLPNGSMVINYGVKIQEFPSKIEILNCGRSGDYFQELNEQEYSLFFNYGWKEGALRLSLQNYKRKLDLVEYKMKAEVNTRKNDKHIQKLKTSRDNLLIKYAKKKQQLIKTQQNGKKEKHL